MKWFKRDPHCEQCGVAFEARAEDFGDRYCKAHAEPILEARAKYRSLMAWVKTHQAEVEKARDAWLEGEYERSRAERDLRYTMAAAQQQELMRAMQQNMRGDSGLQSSLMGTLFGGRNFGEMHKEFPR